MDKAEISRTIRALLPSLVIEGGCFKNNEEKMNFIAHQSGACRCPQCLGKIAVYKKGMGSRTGELALKKFSCTCDYSDDSVGFYSALYGVNNSEAFRQLKNRVLGLDHDAIKALRDQQAAQQKALQTQTNENINLIRANTRWGQDMDYECLALLSSRALNLEALKKDGILERIGYLKQLPLKSQKTDSIFTISGFVFNKENGVKIRKTIDYPRLAFNNEHKLRFLSYGISDAFGSQNLKDDDLAVYITEGEFDALSLISHGTKAIALSGVSNYRAFDAFAAKEDPEKKRVYIIAFDADKAGYLNTASFIHHLENNGYKGFSFNMSNTEKDINDLDQTNPGQLISRIQISTALATHYARGEISKHGLDEMLSSWQKLDELAKVDKDAALKQYDRFHQEISDISLVKPNNISGEKTYELNKTREESGFSHNTKSETGLQRG